MSMLARLSSVIAPACASSLFALVFGLGFGLAFGLACTPDAGSGCSPGTNSCVCLAGNQCFGGLTCQAGICVLGGGGETTDNPGDGDPGDGDPGDGDGDPGDGDGDNPCDGGEQFCGGKCVDTQSNVLHCGGCNIACDSDEQCHEGSCATDCSEVACEGFTWCDPDTSLCLPGCEGDWQCGANQICDYDIHECVCDFGYQLCNGECIWEGDPCADNCGNGVIDPGETCDGNALGGYICQDLDFTGGTLGCLPDCSDFDVSNCTNEFCGNGVVEVGEECDGVNLDGETCLTQGFTGGTLSCTNCSFNTNNCTNDSDDGNCCIAHNGLGCEVQVISACVCALDSYCCQTAWDATCVMEAINDCNANCP